VWIGTTPGGNDICVGTGGCSEGVLPETVYVKISASSGSGTIKPQGSATFSACGVASPAWNPDTVADADSIDVGGCAVTIKHLAGDLSDGSGGRFKDLGLEDQQLDNRWERSRTIEFDDSPSGGCDMDLKFMNQWEVGVGGNPSLIKVFNMKQDKDAGNTLFYGYRLESPNCVFVAGASGACFDDPDVAGNDCGNSPSYDADKKGVLWIQNVRKGGAPPPDNKRAQNVENYNVWECDPADNTNAAGENNFCVSKDSLKPYCDPNLKKCEPCSIVNNNPSNVNAKPNINDCGVAVSDGITVGRCTLIAGASFGGECTYDLRCDVNSDCSTSCCSAVPQTSGPERVPDQELARKCITPASPNNPLSSLISPINSYLCKNV